MDKIVVYEQFPTYERIWNPNVHRYMLKHSIKSQFQSHETVPLKWHSNEIFFNLQPILALFY